MTVGRLTHEPVETLSTSTAKGRLTHEPVETLSTSTAKGRLTQIVIEVLSKGRRVKGSLYPMLT